MEKKAKRLEDLQSQDLNFSVARRRPVGEGRKEGNGKKAKGVFGNLKNKLRKGIGTGTLMDEVGQVNAESDMANRGSLVHDGLMGKPPSGPLFCAAPAYFGDSCVFTLDQDDPEPVEYSAKCVQRSEFAVINRDSLVRIMHDYPFVRNKYVIFRKLTMRDHMKKLQTQKNPDPLASLAENSPMADTKLPMAPYEYTQQRGIRSAQEHRRPKGPAQSVAMATGMKGKPGSAPIHGTRIDESIAMWGHRPGSPYIEEPAPEDEHHQQHHIPGSFAPSTGFGDTEPFELGTQQQPKRWVNPLQGVVQTKTPTSVL